MHDIKYKSKMKIIGQFDNNKHVFVITTYTRKIVLLNKINGIEPTFSAFTFNRKNVPSFKVYIANSPRVDKNMQLQ